ncbi:Glycosyl transferase family 31 [Trinorchestia longiramus]|nr:Glycosyl transferase family 31 [Trinorchestia longiramus]
MQAGSCPHFTMMIRPRFCKRMYANFQHFIEHYLGRHTLLGALLRNRWVYVAYFGAKLFIFLLLLRFSVFSSPQSNAEDLFIDGSSSYTSSRLMDLQNFKYLVNPMICGDSDVLAVVLVHTHPSHKDLRNTFRKHISNEILKDIGIRRAFLIGMANKGQALYPAVKQSDIEAENEEFQDLVQGNFEEHYHNLTYKHVMGLKWATQFCSQASVIIKMDDDIAVDLFQLRQMIKYKYAGLNNTLLGLVQVDSHVLRTNGSKWRVTEEEFKGNTYPTFLSGWCYIAPMETVQKLALNAHAFPYFWIDDVLVTGIMAEKLGITREGLNHKYTIHAGFLQCCTQENYSPYKYYCDYYVAPTNGNLELFSAALDQFNYCYRRGCEKRPGNKMLVYTCIAKQGETPLGRGVGEVIML